MLFQNFYKKIWFRGLDQLRSLALKFKVGRFFPMVISSDFRMGEHRDDDHEEDAPYFRIVQASKKGSDHRDYPRIPTVKLKIPGKAFLKSESRTSATGRQLRSKTKVGSILLMVVVSMLPHAEIGGNDHREDAPQFIT